jgi:beta-lactamase class A
MLMTSPGCKPPSAGSITSVDLRDSVSVLVSAYPDAVVALYLDDPVTETTVAINSDRLFHAASTMKIPVLIELYRRAETGDLSLDDSLQIENRFASIVDGSEYSIEDDSDDAIYERLGTRMSFRDLAYQMITVSSNLATNLLVGYLGAESIQATSERLGTRKMLTLRGVEDLKAYERGLSNRTTAGDLAVLLTTIKEYRAVSPVADSSMVALLLAQQFNSMIPRGLPEGVRVAHKTGSITEIHHDAAIIFPPDGTSYVLVILTEGIADQGESSDLGADISAMIYRMLRPGGK